MREQIQRIFSDDPFNRGYFLSGYEEEGEYKSWHDNGQLRIRGVFTNKIRDGEYKHWNKNGRLTSNYFNKNAKSYSIEQAKKLFPEGPWLDR
jgi:antitoxin component YwqK of YwqJK toxin-antitoxin module